MSGPNPRPPSTPHSETPGQVWAGLVRGLGGDAGAAAAAGAELDERYAEPHRRYHSGAHVVAVLRDARLLADELDVPGPELAPLLLAVCAHDVVYDARPGDDERASADWAGDRLAHAGVDPAIGARVGELVLSTLTHEAGAEDAAAVALLDADLAILAASPDAYGRYVSAVRFEYRTVTEDQWRSGRAAVLRGLADRPFIYASAPARTWWEDAARTNLTTELAALEEAS